MTNITKNTTLILNNMRKTAQKIVIGLGILIVVFWGYLSIAKPFWNEPEITKCGTVQNTLATEKPVKSHLYNELYLGIKFDSGEFEAVNVSPTTYMQKKPGDRVCFTNEDTSYMPYWMSSFMFFVSLAVVFLYFLVLIIVNIFSDDE